jgi:hypothetical protein
VYVIEVDHLAYEPVTPAQSSSGMYSGGEPNRVALTGARHAAITALADRILADTASHLATRPKGCGTIVRGDARVSFASPLQRELEAMLNAALSGA